MEASTVNESTFYLKQTGTATSKVPAKVTPDPANENVVVLDPQDTLAPKATYVATVTRGASDLAGNALDQDPTTTGSQQKAWRFTTGTSVVKTFEHPADITLTSEVPASSASPYPSEIGVSGFASGSVIQDVDLSLNNFGHATPDDVDVLLVHGETNRTIVSDAGGSDGVSDLTVVLDDEAPEALPDDGPWDGTGSFHGKPTNYPGGDTFPGSAPDAVSKNAPLRGFDGADPNGSWQLYVVDDTATTDASGEQLAGGWSLTIKVRVPTS